MLCVCMYETIDKTRVCRPLYVMGYGTFVCVWQVFIMGIFICMLLGLLWLYRPQLRMVLPFGYWKFSIRLRVSHWFIWTHIHICTILGLVNQSNSINVIEYPLSFIHYHLYSQYVDIIYLQMSIYMFVHMNTYSCVNYRLTVGQHMSRYSCMHHMHYTYDF